MEKNKCANCETDNFVTSKYCSNCGYELPKLQFEDAPQNIPVKSKRKLTNSQMIGIIVGMAVAAIVSTGVQKWLFPKPTIDKVLVELASKLNKEMCPMMLDMDTRADNAMALPNKTFLYNYTLVNFENGMIDTTEIKKIIEPNIINGIKTNPNMEYFRDNKVTMRYYYKDKNGNYLFSIIVTPEQYK